MSNLSSLRAQLGFAIAILSPGTVNNVLSQVHPALAASHWDSLLCEEDGGIGLHR